MKRYLRTKIETIKTHDELSARLYQLRKVKLQGILSEIASVTKTLDMLATAQDTSTTVAERRNNLLRDAISEKSRPPQDLRFADLDLSDKTYTPEEQNWYLSYLEQNPELEAKNAGSDDCVRHLLARRKAAKYA